MTEPYRLVYWPHIPGRGEPIRWLLEDTGITYDDVARKPESEGGGMAAVIPWLYGKAEHGAVFAPPVLIRGELILSQTAVICRFLGERHGLAPTEESRRALAQQHLLTVLDLLVEAHDTHHPLGVSLYYEDQKQAAKQRAELFVGQRMPRYLEFFETVLERNDGDHLVGARASYADLTLCYVLHGLAYAFPRGFARATKNTPRLLSLRNRISSRPSLAEYLGSDRCLPFNEQGIFRHYPELDA